MEIEVVGVWNGELGWHVFMKGFRVACVHKHMFLLCISDFIQLNGIQVADSRGESRSAMGPYRFAVVSILCNTNTLWATQC